MRVTCEDRHICEHVGDYEYCDTCIRNECAKLTDKFKKNVSRETFYTIAQESRHLIPMLLIALAINFVAVMM